jgi:GR25 family glycosyltransferase involved in LPS biosynthesis
MLKYKLILIIVFSIIFNLFLIKDCSNILIPIINKQEMLTSLDWSSFENKTFCMTLKSTPERTSHAKKEFEKVGLEKIVEFVFFDKHPNGSVIGIWEGHTEILKKALQKKLDYVLIFEDDIVFDERFINQQLINETVYFIEKNVFDIFYLTHLPWDIQSTHNPHIYWVKSVFLWAHIVSNKWMKYVVENWPNNTKEADFIDDWYAYKSNNSYGLYPNIAYTKDELVEDNYWGLIGEIRRTIMSNQYLWFNDWLLFLVKYRNYIPVNIENMRYSVVIYVFFFKLIYYFLNLFCL